MWRYHDDRRDALRSRPILASRAGQTLLLTHGFHLLGGQASLPATFGRQTLLLTRGFHHLNIAAVEDFAEPHPLAPSNKSNGELFVWSSLPSEMRWKSKAAFSSPVFSS